MGDIALLEPGEIIPCDGVFLRGHGVRCDESSATGESDAVKKCSYEECLENMSEEGHDGHKSDCFLISGSKVLEGVGEYVIIAIGPKSFHGRIMLGNFNCPISNVPPPSIQYCSIGMTLLVPADI